MQMFVETKHGPFHPAFFLRCQLLEGLGYGMCGFFEKKKPLRRKAIASPWKQQNNRLTYFANTAILFDNWVI
jgi:hypothetical protein